MTSPLTRLRARGHSVAIVGRSLRVLPSLPADDPDLVALRADLPAAFAALRAEAQPEPHSEPPGQPPTHPALPAAPTAPEPPPILFRDRPIRDDQIRDCYENEGGLDAWLSGRIDRRTAERHTLDWLRNHAELTDAFISTLFGGSL